MNESILDDVELRDLTIELLRAPTARDKQRALGASDLADQCDRCLAMKFGGVKRAEPIQSARLWLGALFGTSMHGEIERRIQLHSADIESPMFNRVTHTYPEMRHPICKIAGYGTIYGTIDWSMERQIVDWKGSTRKKTALLRDFLAITAGKVPIFGRQHRHVKLSEKEYAEQMAGMVHKMNGYFAQVQFYCHARAAAGRPVERGSIVWINRDGNGYFDLPHGNRYNDEAAMHDIWPLSFDYSPEAAQAGIARAQRIHDLVKRGVPFEEFPQSEHCWTCMNEEQEDPHVPSVIQFGDQKIAA